MSNTNLLPSYSEGLTQLRSNLTEILPKESLEIFDQDAIALQELIPKNLKIKVGDLAPDFTLSNALGENINLKEQLKHHRVVLVFYRGTWCPYCNLALSQYQAAINEIEKLNAKVIAISPQTPDESLTIKEKNNLKFEVLSDNGNMVAKSYTAVFANPNSSIEEMTKLGFDYGAYYSDDSNEIPLPSVFIIDQTGKVMFARSEGGDYRQRTEVDQIIQMLSK